MQHFKIYILENSKIHTKTFTKPGLKNIVISDATFFFFLSLNFNSL